MALSQSKFFGLVELDATGTVLYSTLEDDGQMPGAAANLAGLNFYSEVAPFLNVEEFHRHLDNFNRGSEQANSFVFDCDYEDGTVQVRVLLARISERSNNNRTQSLLVHIKKAD